jgi:hypothetical protein
VAAACDLFVVCGVSGTANLIDSLERRARFGTIGATVRARHPHSAQLLNRSAA